MHREEVTRALSEFEAKEPVGEMRWRGELVWPAVRTRAAMRLLTRGRPGASAAPPGIRARLSAALRRRRPGATRSGPRLEPAELVFLTSGNRCQPLGRARIHTVVGPWVEAFRATGRSVAVWATGVRTPMRGGATHVEPAWREARRRAHAAAPGAPPSWFAPFQEHLERELHAEIAWPELFRELSAVAAASALFGPWLRRAAARALILDCWYGREALGAATAAHRLGLPVVDLQHGLQGRGHPAYDAWGPRAAAGSAGFPDRFWVWGERDAAALAQGSPAAVGREAISLAGNRWLASWVAGADPLAEREVARAARLVDGRRALLVTLQHRVPYRDVLEPLLRAAPKDWIWLVRLHRAMAETPERVEAQLRAATGARVEAVAATRRPLQAWLRVCDWQLTGFSTCALEALPFGVPTLLWDESGARAYADLVSRDVMALHADADSSLRRLAGATEARAEACRRAAREVFAEPADPERLWAELEEHVGRLAASPDGW